MTDKIYGFFYGRPFCFIGGVMLFWIVFWAVVATIFRKKKCVFWQSINLLGMAISVIVIMMLTVFSRVDTGETDLMLRPFYSLAEAKIQPEMYRTMIMNVFLFFPLGLTLPFVYDSNTKHPVRKTILFAALFSTTIEIIQYCFKLGRCETDDVIMNILGTVVGSSAYLNFKIISGIKNK